MTDPTPSVTTPDLVLLDVDAGSDKEAVIGRLATVLADSGRSTDRDGLTAAAMAREGQSATGLPGGIAIPHCRSLVVDHLRLAYGQHRTGVEFQAIDAKPVHHFFLIVAPPLEISNQYLPVLGRIAQFCKDVEVPDRLSQLRNADEFFNLLEAKGV